MKEQIDTFAGDAPQFDDITMLYLKDSGMLVIRFVYSGIPFNPLKRKNPDVTLSAEERNIGGLGIYMVKKSMDDVAYEYKDGHNILTIKKKIS